MTGDAIGGDLRRGLPSVDVLLRRGETDEWIGRWGREPVTMALRRVLDENRRTLDGGGTVPDDDSLLAAALCVLETDRPSLRPVINATGVILHTNLGRAPLAEAAIAAATEVARGYSSLEYDLDEGKRGDRYEHCAGLICLLSGSESALVVNNNAAAVSLAINSLARGREVLVSRGELVEIGGGFRIPEVIEQSGAFLRAVGTTNRTRIDDYRRAITPSTGLLLKVHPSNYRVEGFVEETRTAELVELGGSVNLPVMHDLGSGLLLPVTLPEPRVRDSVASGADLVTWSGDKLLGGPQAGIIHGRAAVVDRLRDNPLARAFRVDKMTLAALEATLRLYLSPELAASAIPVLRMIVTPVERVTERARAALADLTAVAAERVTVASMRSVLGGGTAPGFELPSAGWVFSGSAEAHDAGLRAFDPPIVGRIEGRNLRLDFRTVLEGQEAIVSAAVNRLIREEQGET